jgi:hypothetical protein
LRIDDVAHELPIGVCHKANAIREQAGAGRRVQMSLSADVRTASMTAPTRRLG